MSLDNELELTIEACRILDGENAKLKAQVEQLRGPLRNLINVEHERGGSLQIDGQFAYKVKERIFKDAANALDKTPAQCLAEVRAQAVEGAISITRQAFDGLGPKWFCKVEALENYANQLRQQAKL